MAAVSASQVKLTTGKVVDRAHYEAVMQTVRQLSEQPRLLEVMYKVIVVFKSERVGSVSDKDYKKLERRGLLHDKNVTKILEAELLCSGKVVTLRSHGGAARTPINLGRVQPMAF